MEKQTIKEYTSEELETDILWFSGLGVGRAEAKSYINYLLDRVRK